VTATAAAVHMCCVSGSRLAPQLVKRSPITHQYVFR
jgi:hypothetical protein